ncbi:MAG: DUF72 domain-containing protein [Solirubrobacteraceae bacterium]
MAATPARTRSGATVRVGISGWVYPPWRGVFYPKGLTQKRELEYASGKVSTIEINGSFYSLQRPEIYRAWREQTPEGFVFSVKGGRFITHMKRLLEPELSLANFFASGVLALGDKLGPLLWQLPPNFQFDAKRLDDFFAHLPRTTTQAAAIARTHDERLEGRALTETDAERPVRHALEVRHPSFNTPALLELLREHEVAMVVADSAGRFPQIREVTTDFAYVRLHGADELYVSGYSDEKLDDWAAYVCGIAETGRDVFVYFDNDAKVHAPYNAMTLAAKILTR